MNSFSRRSIRFDVVVPIHDALHVTRFCLSALDRTSPPDRVRVTCVLDACDARTREVVTAWCAERPNFRAVALDRNVGFVGACNAGLELATGEYAVLVNSDACATAGWSERFEACFLSDARIGLASPLSNFCPHNSVPMRSGSSLDEMARLAAERTPAYPDITTCEGFFLAARRRTLDDIGFLDEIFGQGYCEESDLSLRANYFGWRTVLVDDCYVFHYGRESFGSAARLAQYEKNKRVLFDRWDALYARDFPAMKDRDVISSIRSELAGDLPAVKWV